VWYPLLMYLWPLTASGIAVGTGIALCTIWPTAIAYGSALPSGPIWVYPLTAGTAFAVVWPVTILAARLAMRHKPFEAIAVPGQ
jgi:putative ABC transport system permease protein